MRCRSNWIRIMRPDVFRY